MPPDLEDAEAEVHQATAATSGGSIQTVSTSTELHKDTSTYSTTAGREKVFLTEPISEEPIESPETLELIKPRGAEEKLFGSPDLGLFSTSSHDHQTEHATPLIMDLTSTKSGFEPRRAEEQRKKPLIEVLSSSENPPPEQGEPNPAPLIKELRNEDQDDFSSLKPSGDLLGDTSEGMPPAETVDNRMIVELGDDTDSTMQQVKLPVKSKESAESKPVRSIAGALPPDSIEMTDGQEWAAPTEKSKQVRSGVTTGSHNTSAVEQQHGSGLVIEEVGSDDEGSSMADEPGIQLSDVPAVKDLSEVRRTESALESLRSKPESQLTAEDKIWQLAAKGGSTLESDRVELDPQTKERLHERLGDAGLLDKVSIPL